MANPYRGDRIVVHKPHDLWMVSVVDAEDRVLGTSSVMNMRFTDEQHKKQAIERANGLASWLGIDQVEVRDE